MEWLSPACPRIICFFNRGNFIEGTNSLKIIAWCLCTYVLFWICVGIDLVDLTWESLQGWLCGFDLRKCAGLTLWIWLEKVCRVDCGFDLRKSTRLTLWILLEKVCRFGFVDLTWRRVQGWLCGFDLKKSVGLTLWIWLEKKGLHNYTIMIRVLNNDVHFLMIGVWSSLGDPVQLTRLLMITANSSIILLVVFTTLPSHYFIIITIIYLFFKNQGWGGGEALR